jgi:hypothetical protein
MVVSQQTAKELVFQAVALMEEYLANRPKEPVASAYRSAVLLSLPLPPVWLTPHVHRDEAARVAVNQLLNSKDKVGYLAAGECAVHAMTRIWLLLAGANLEAIASRGVEKDEFPPLIKAAEALKDSSLVVSDQDLSGGEITMATRRFIEQSQLQVLVIDEPDAPTLRDNGLLPELDRWRTRMEFREAVRGTNVMMILPG